MIPVRRWARLLIGLCLAAALRAAVADEPPAPRPYRPTGDAAGDGSMAAEPRPADRVGAEAAQIPQPPASPGPRTPPQPFKIMLYDNDFRYKQDPAHDWLLGEELKDMPVESLSLFQWLPEPSRLSYGGELRYRLMDERNQLRPPEPPGHSNYDLVRWRQYVDWHVGDDFRAYVEMIDASFDRGQQPPQTSDINRWDVWNGFIDARIAEVNERPIYLRAGRQTLIYGSYRLLSPSMFANSPQNFDGFKLFSPGETWDVDAFLMRPNVISPHQFDSPNLNDTLAGVWSTFKGWDQHLIDLYWIWNNLTNFPAGSMGGNRHTLGGRWLRHWPIGGTAGEPDEVYHAELEGAWQFGSQSGKAVEAGFFTAGAGHTWNAIPWKPDAWLLFDWASGNRNPNGGTINTFYQLFPWTHRFLGLIDNVGRQNIMDLNGRVVVNPTEKISFEAQGHWFNLASTNDVLYTVSGTPVGTPGNGRSIGEELDLTGTYTFNQNFNVQVAWFHFWYGEFIERTAPRGPASLFYVQTTLNY
jgi:hypothetical protein